jgi:uncharacterized protein YjdB
MKKVMKSAVVTFALALSLSLGFGVTADAAKVTVKKVSSVDKLTGKKTITLAKGKSAKLKTTVTVTPNKAANKKVTYKSKNTAIAKVTASGKITAKKVGTTKIVVTSKKNTKKSAKVTVKVVKAKVKKVTLDKTEVSLVAGATEEVKATVKASGKKANKTIKWTSSDETVATVKGGVITAVAAGKATITAQTTDGTNIKKSVKVLVKGTEIKLAEDAKEITTTIAFKKDGKIADDFEAIVKAAGLEDKTEVELTVNGKKVKKSVAEARKLIKDKKATSVKLTIAAAEAKKYGVVGTLLAPVAVESVEVDGVKFTEITASSFKIGTKTYTYHVISKDTIVVDDHVADDFKNIKAITAVNNAF